VTCRLQAGDLVIQTLCRHPESNEGSPLTICNCESPEEIATSFNNTPRKDSKLVELLDFRFPPKTLAGGRV